eukprot:2305895-Prymnesium_polylepis.1
MGKRRVQRQDTCFFPAAPAMAADAAVLVALRRQSTFSHRSLDGGGPLDRCTETLPTRRPRSDPTVVSSGAGWSGGAAFFAAFGT